jgi:deoxyadenosine/deoxycytidine kinase
MSELTEQIAGVLNLIPTELQDKPNDLIGLLIRAKAEIDKDKSRIQELEARLQIDTLNPNRREHIVQLTTRIAELKKENDWLFDFALGYTNIDFLNDCLKELKEVTK